MDSRSLRATASQETLISLLQLEPQPMPDTDKDLPPLPEESSDGTRTEADTEKETTRSIGSRDGPGHARTSSLGLSGSGNGSIYYREFFSLSSVRTTKVTTNVAIYPSDANTTVLDLRPVHIHRPAHREHVHNTPRHPLRARLRGLPPARPRDLPDPNDRAPLRRPPHRRPHRLGRSPAPGAPLAEPQALRRRDPGRPAHQVVHGPLLLVIIERHEVLRLAADELDLRVGVRLRGVPVGARGHQPAAAAARRGRQLQHRAGVRGARVRVAPGRLVRRLRRLAGAWLRAHGLGVGEVDRARADGGLGRRHQDRWDHARQERGHPPQEAQEEDMAVG